MIPYDSCFPVLRDRGGRIGQIRVSAGMLCNGKYVGEALTGGLVGEGVEGGFVYIGLG